MSANLERSCTIRRATLARSHFLSSQTLKNMTSGMQSFFRLLYWLTTARMWRGRACSSETQGSSRGQDGPRRDAPVVSPDSPHGIFIFTIIFQISYVHPVWRCLYARGRETCHPYQLNYCLPFALSGGHRQIVVEERQTRLIRGKYENHPLRLCF